MRCFTDDEEDREPDSIEQYHEALEEALKE